VNVSHLSLEMNAIRIRTQRLTAVSFAVHVLLILWLVLMPTITRDDAVLTEITWLEPAPPAPASPQTVAAKSEPAKERSIPQQRPSVHDTREHFKRERQEADVTLEPQKLETTADKLNERLAVLQQKTVSEPAKLSVPISSSPVGKLQPAGLPEQSRKPAELTRQKTAGSTPIELKRTPKRVQQAATLSTSLPEREVAPTRSPKTDTQARKMLAGASLTGPVADRPLLYYCKPEYPEWAKREAVEGSVSITFVVLPDGSIKENIMVEKTSGFVDFDDNAAKALLTWRFEPIGAGKTGEQWGTITFHYRLSGS
jgi:TonB family protein